MKSNPYLKEDVLENFKTAFGDITKSFDSDIMALDKELEKSSKRERIDKIFPKSKIGVDYTDAQLRELYRRGSERYGKKMPPGMDNGNPAERERYRDYIIWKEMQGFASYFKRNIVMVRGSKTTDWFNLDDSNRILGPNPSIVSEFAVKTAETSNFYATFYCLDLVTFLEKCHQYGFLDAPSEKLISQLKEMLNLPTYAKNAISLKNSTLSSNSTSAISEGAVKK